MSVMPQRSPRNHRTNPYPLDRLLGQVHHSAAGSLWRFRTELSALLAGTAGVWELAKTVTLTWAMIITATLALAAITVPPIRRLTVRRAWCVLSRHQISAEDFEAHAPEIAAACCARQVRIEGDRRWAQLVQVDIVRRDTLAPHLVITPGLRGAGGRGKAAS